MIKDEREGKGEGEQTLTTQKRETTPRGSARDAGAEGATVRQRSATGEASGRGPDSRRRPTRRRALLLSPGQLWGLRFMALGAVLVAAALIGAFVLLVGGDDDDSAESAAERSGLTERFTKRGAGLSVFHPENWKRSEREGIVNLESGDRCVVISLSAPVSAALWNRLFADSVQSLREAGKGAQLGRPGGSVVIGGAPTRTAIVALRNKRGVPVTVRLSVSRGRRLAHLLQVVTRAPSCEDSIGQSGAIIDSIQYTR